jgi:hypothetical protein
LVSFEEDFYACIAFVLDVAFQIVVYCSAIDEWAKPYALDYASDVDLHAH